MTRHVSSLVQALDAAIPGETGHEAVNRMLMLHETDRARSEADSIAYWTLRGRLGKAVDTTAPAEGDDLVRRLVRLHDTLELTKGVELTRDLREHQKAEYWILRSRIARDASDASIRLEDIPTT